MWLNKKRYNQYLDFGYIEKKMEKMPDGDGVLHDMEEIPKESVVFFRKLANASSISDLADYSKKGIVELIDLMLNSMQMVHYICSLANDDTILGDSEHLKRCMRERRLAAMRRVL